MNTLWDDGVGVNTFVTVPTLLRVGGNIHTDDLGSESHTSLGLFLDANLDLETTILDSASRNLCYA